MLTHILRIIGRLLGVIVCLSLGPATTLVAGDATLAGDWRRASHERTGIAPAPTFVREALVQLRMRKHTGQVEKTHELRDLRKDIARLETIINEKNSAAA